AEAMGIAERMWQRGFQDSFATEGGDREMTDKSTTGVDPSHGSAAGATAPADPAAERIRSVTALVPQLVQSARRPEQPPPPPLRREARPDVEVLAFVEGRTALWRYSRGAAAARLERIGLPLDEARRLVSELRAHPE